MTHQELMGSAASYALDALDSDERAAFEAHLVECRECQAEVAVYREVAGALVHTAPAVTPPDASALRDRIMRDARQVRPIGIVARPAAPVAPAPSASVTPKAESMRARAGVVPWTVAAASLAAALVFGFVYQGERERSQRLTAELAATQATLASTDSTLASVDSTLAAFVGPEVHVVSLAAPDQKPSVRVFWNHTRNTYIVTAFRLPRAPEGKTYQLWALRKGKPPLSMGTFDANPNGRAVTAFPVAQAITDGGFIDDCALTVEPAGGSSQPTETPRLIGSWRHVD